MVSAEAEIARPMTRTALHALGNVFLGMAVGLLLYYLVTDAVGQWQQAGLREELSTFGAAGSQSPDRLMPDEEEDDEEEDDEETPSSPWDGWSTQDGAYWADMPADGVFGRLIIEAMELDAVVVRGVGTEELKRGPGWMPYTDVPGPFGNVGIAAHRTTYGAPFRRLDDLQPGDTIYFYSPFRRYTYVVTEKLIVTPDRVDVVQTSEEPMLTLSACHPMYSAQYRLIVHADLTEVHRLAQPASTDE